MLVTMRKALTERVVSMVKRRCEIRSEGNDIGRENVVDPTVRW